jgi:hypothetical protein
MVLAVAPLSVFSVTVGSNNGLSCEPRYMLPLAVPLATALVLVLSATIVWRLSAVAFTVACVFASFVTATHYAGPSQPVTTRSQVAVPEVEPVVRQLQERHVDAVIADYWLQRPVLYYSGLHIKAAEYGGAIGFEDLQAEGQSAADPSWLFLKHDPDVEKFERIAATKGISYQREDVGDAILFTHLTAPLRPSDLGY